MMDAGFAEYAGFTQDLTSFGRPGTGFTPGLKQRKIIDAIGAKESFPARFRQKFWVNRIAESQESGIL
jgi:hypothetical protein